MRRHNGEGRHEGRGGSAAGRLKQGMAEAEVGGRDVEKELGNRNATGKREGGGGREGKEEGEGGQRGSLCCFCRLGGTGGPSLE